LPVLLYDAMSTWSATVNKLSIH